MATFAAATFFRKRTGRNERSSGAPRLGSAPVWLRTHSLQLGLILSLLAAPASAASNKVRITKLSDVAFGTIANLGVDASVRQDVCLYSSSSTSGYNVTATGTGPGGAFTLSSGTASLPYDVQWNSSAGRSAGTQLTANVPLTGQVSGATQQTCNSGPPTTASLIVILRSAALSSASAGAYSGSLTLLVGPE